jgi:hypothetical protein
MHTGIAKLALAMLVSISEGLCLEGELAAILFRALADMSAAGKVSWSAGQRKVQDVDLRAQIGRCVLAVPRLANG